MGGNGMRVFRLEDGNSENTWTVCTEALMRERFDSGKAWQDYRDEGGDLDDVIADGRRFGTIRECDEREHRAYLDIANTYVPAMDRFGLGDGDVEVKYVPGRDDAYMYCSFDTGATRGGKPAGDSGMLTVMETLREDGEERNDGATLVRGACSSPQSLDMCEEIMSDIGSPEDGEEAIGDAVHEMRRGGLDVVDYSDDCAGGDEDWMADYAEVAGEMEWDAQPMPAFRSVGGSAGGGRSRTINVPRQSEDLPGAGGGSGSGGSGGAGGLRNGSVRSVGGETYVYVEGYVKSDGTKVKSYWRLNGGR